MDDSLPFLLVTANVGSVFEDPCRLLNTWIQEFLTMINIKKPAFIALHLQEVGGKTYEKSMEYVQEFIKNLCESEELKDFNRIRVYLDEDYNSAEHFTALGNLYFAVKSITQLDIWNFLTHQWEMVEGKNIHTGNIESVATKEKSKFPQHFFPECKWSRKGFLRTRWRINGTMVDMVNIHLFHDASNLAACEEFPSVYCKSRRRALVYTLDRFYRDSVNGKGPYFIFGDFNFRCDTEGVVKNLTEDLTVHRQQNTKNDYNKVHYRDSDGKNILTVGKKEFTHNDHQTKFKENWLQEFDRELEPLTEILLEYPINFPPSYPYEEDPQLPVNFMLTRCPAWCDRILMSPAARRLIANENEVIYNIIGNNVCMGDHKPVYLQTKIKTNQGIVLCCCVHDKTNNNKYSDNDSSQSQKYTQIISEHLPIISNIECSEPIDSRDSRNANNKCLYCTNEYARILEENKLYLDISNNNNVNSNNNSNDKSDSILMANSNNKNFVKINVTDTENNLNVCMCALYESNENLITNHRQSPILHAVKPSSPANNLLSIDGTICPRCRNIIKQQPIEHRRTLISKRSLLANDIIVNRIDTHYLNTYTDSDCKFQDPYTPESIESHSPFNEVFAEETKHLYSEKNDTPPTVSLPPISSLLQPQQQPIPGAQVIKQISIKSLGVSPKQLKSKLELLRNQPVTNNFANSTTPTSETKYELNEKLEMNGGASGGDDSGDGHGGNSSGDVVIGAKESIDTGSNEVLTEKFIEGALEETTKILNNLEKITADDILNETTASQASHSRSTTSNSVCTRYVEISQTHDPDVFYGNSVIFRETTI